MDWLTYKKDYVVWYHNVRTGAFYDVTKSIYDITITTTIDGSAGKMTCKIANKDNIEIELGGTLSIDYGQWSGNNGTHVYLGFIFDKKYSDDNYTEEITCYDHLRYLKNTYTMSTENLVLEQVVYLLCCQFHIPIQIWNDTKGHILAPVQFDNETGTNIIQHCINDVKVYTTERMILRDEFGQLMLLNIRSCGKNYHLKWNESITHYNYETEIDSNTFNVVELVYGKMNGTTYEVAHKVVSTDADGQMLYGWLKNTKVVDGWFDNIQQVINATEHLLDATKKATIKIDLECVGVPELKAGDIIFITIPVGNNEKRTVNYIMNGQSIQLDTSQTNNNTIIPYRGEMTMMVLINECTHKIQQGWTTTNMQVIPMDYELYHKEYKDKGYGAWYDEYAKEAAVKNEQRLENLSGLVRPI